MDDTYPKPRRPFLRPLTVGLLFGSAAALIGAGPAMSTVETAAPATSPICQGLQNELRMLQGSLNTAPANQKAFILSEIREIRQELIADGC